MTGPKSKIKATCHCGTVEIEATLSNGLEEPRRCDCSFCRRRGAANVSAPVDTLRVVKGADNLGLYTWGTHTAQHYFCKTCGIYTHHQRRSDPNDCGVNLGCIEGVNPSEFEPIPWLDGVSFGNDEPKQSSPE